MSWPQRVTRAAGALLQAGQAVDQLRLAVAVDAGDADDLAGPGLKADVVDGVAACGYGRARVRSSTCSTASPGWAGVLHHLQLHRAAHHHVGQGLLVGVLGVHGADVLALAQHRDPVGHRHDLVELVGDEEDGLALPGETPS